MSAEDKEITEKMNALMDLLSWFHDHGVALTVTPKPDGWNVQFKITFK